MTPQTHTFAIELERQRKLAADWFRWYGSAFGGIRAASVSEDQSGIDFWGNRAGREISIQLKVDIKSDETGNLFVEWKIETCGEYPHTVRPGWAQMLHAEEYWFYRPGHQQAICIGNGALMDWVGRAVGRPLFGPVHNQDPRTGDEWDAWGYLMRLREAETLGTAHRVARPTYGAGSVGRVNA